MSAELDTVAAKLVEHEGFEGLPYDDHLGHPTIGYGTLLPLSREEAYMLLRHRLKQAADEMTQAIPWWRDLPTMPANALLNMAYQMGVPGLLAFKKTLAHLREGRYAAAADESLDSLWARQTPSRAKAVSDMMRASGELA